MDKYTLQEEAYKNGYSKGFTDGAKRDGSEWVYAESGEIICKACGSRMPKFYEDGTAVPKYNQNFCHYCGSKMRFNLKG